MITGSDRYELRITRFSPASTYGTMPALSVVARYASFTGDRPGGHVASLWLAFGIY